MTNEEFANRCVEILELSPTYQKHRQQPSLCWCEMCAYVRGNVIEIKRFMRYNQSDNIWRRIKTWIKKKSR